MGLRVIKVRQFIEDSKVYLLRHKLLVGGGILTLLWCIPYFTTGNKTDYGDFTFFAQAYEAMRMSVVDYHQFPFWNPWVSGGVPLFANPQMGFFSPQMVLVFLFGAPVGIKLAIVLFTLAGYASMYLLLRKYFKIQALIAVPLSLIWIFSSFFVAHLPAHFTFVWYMLTPLFVYQCLTLVTKRQGIYLGLSLGVMALSQIHNPFFHIILICGAILLFRLFKNKALRKNIAIALVCTGITFIAVAGYRAVLTIQNVTDFPRMELTDHAPRLTTALMGPFVPTSSNFPFNFINYPQNPNAPWGYIEVTATIGILALIATLIGLLHVAYIWRTKGWKTIKRDYKLELILIGLAALSFSLALGKYSDFSTYNLLKQLPVFSSMRVSTRWFLFFNFCILLFLGVVAKKFTSGSFAKFLVIVLLYAGAAELFVLNAGYQRTILTFTPVKPAKATKDYPFVQTSYFGESLKLSDGTELVDDGKMPHAYREYDATLYNQGILYANDSLVQLALDPRRNPGHPTCPVEEGCDLVRTPNARITYWSPNKIVLERTADGPIFLNMNNSSYFLINGVRDRSINVAEPFTDFVINDPSETITLTTRPSITKAIGL